MNAKRYSLKDISEDRHYWVSQVLTDDDLNEPTGVSCDSCGVRLLLGAWLGSGVWKDGDNAGCNGCGQTVYHDALAWQTEVPQELLGIVAADDFWRQRWYHATTNSSWATDAREATGPLIGDSGLLIHAGSRLAALNRADDIYGERGGAEIYLYSFQLRGISAVARNFILKDDNSWQEWLSGSYDMPIGASSGKHKGGDRAHLEADGHRAATYYNCYEMPGELSLILDSKLVQLNTVTREKLTRAI